MKTKTFDCVQWIRDIRDTNYNQHKNLSTKDFSEHLSREARKSDLWKKFNKTKPDNKA